jgi:hypothetical protein
MNKKVIFIGLGVLAVAAGAFFIFRKPSVSTSSTGKSPEDSLPPQSTPEGSSVPSGSDYTDIDAAGLFSPSASSGGAGVDKSRGQVRRDCRREARAKYGRGLRARKDRRNYRRTCKAQGGFDDGVEEFAFNGFEDQFGLD